MKLASPRGPSACCLCSSVLGVKKFPALFGTYVNSFHDAPYFALMENLGWMAASNFILDLAI
jgi:hypothetical protein